MKELDFGPTIDSLISDGIIEKKHINSVLEANLRLADKFREGVIRYKLSKMREIISKMPDDVPKKYRLLWLDAVNYLEKTLYDE